MFISLFYFNEIENYYQWSILISHIDFQVQLFYISLSKIYNLYPYRCFLLHLIQSLIKYIIIVLLLINSYIFQRLFFFFFNFARNTIFFVNNTKYSKLNNYNFCNKNHKYSNIKELKTFRFFQKLQQYNHSIINKIYLACIIKKFKYITIILWEKQSNH